VKLIIELKKQEVGNNDITNGRVANLGLVQVAGDTAAESD